MTSYGVASDGLYQALKAEGFELPKNCGTIELEMPVDGAFVIHYRVFIDAEDMQKLGRALARLGKEQDSRDRLHA